MSPNDSPLWLPPENLPPPSPEALVVGQRLVERIRREIGRCQGAIPFSRYMEMVLYDPGLGYYSAGARKFGAEGDFTTAPERSGLFRRCIARQCGQILAGLDGGDILELGAGSGILAQGILQELKRTRGPLRHYYILELSADLRQRQSERLAPFGDQVQWLDSLPEHPLRGVILANEVLDAMPVELFRIAAQGPERGLVSWREGCFELKFTHLETAELATAIQRLTSETGPLALDYRSEINLTLTAWVKALAKALGQGAALLIDYGYPRREYYHPQRRQGTLMCHYRHHAHPDPLLLPGLQDITASVDFTALAEAGLQAGLSLAGYTSQAHFLMGCGLLEIAAERDPREIAAHMDMAQEVKWLTLPGQTGERFKVMGLQRGFDVPWIGFSPRDQRGHL